MWSSARSEAALEAAIPVPINVRPVKRAKRYRLRFDEASGTLKLSCPWRASRKQALAWALKQGEWIEAQLARAAPPEPFVPGACFPLEGEEVRIAWNERAPRTPRLAGAELHCGGPLSGLSRQVERFLRRRALAVLSDDVRDYCKLAGAQPAKITVGDAATRWGSCSSAGRIRFSWRLILAPPQARRFVAAHEVGHLRHLDHGAKFKALERRLFGPGLGEAKVLLEEWAPRLRRIGRR